MSQGDEKSKGGKEEREAPTPMFADINFAFGLGENNPTKYELFIPINRE